MGKLRSHAIFSVFCECSLRILCGDFLIGHKLRDFWGTFEKSARTFREKNKKHFWWGSNANLLKKQYFPALLNKKNPIFIG
jgi:hypothetical protein